MPAGENETQNGSGSEIRSKYRFLVYFREEGQDFFVAGFNSISGLESEVNVVEWRTGDNNETKKLPGFGSHPPIVLERAYDAGTSLKDWYDEVFSSAQGTGAGEYRKDLVIEILNRNGTTYRKIVAVNAWPSKYSASDLDASSEDPWTESIEVQNNGWDFEDIGNANSTDSNTSS